MATENKYKNGKIYKIVSENTDKIYIGSTCHKLSKRLIGHKADYQSYKKGRKNFMTSFKILEEGNFNIILLERLACENKEQLHARERHYIELYKDIVVNKLIPCRTDKQYRNDNKERISTRMKRYREDNKEKINQYMHIKQICECGSQYSLRHKSRHMKSDKHQKIVNNNIKIRLTQKEFNLLFKLDSQFKIPSTYTNIELLNY